MSIGLVPEDFNPMYPEEMIEQVISNIEALLAVYVGNLDSYDSNKLTLTKMYAIRFGNGLMSDMSGIESVGPFTFKDNTYTQSAFLKDVMAVGGNTGFGLLTVNLNFHEDGKRVGTCSLCNTFYSTGECDCG